MRPAAALALHTRTVSETLCSRSHSMDTKIKGFYLFILRWALIILLRLVLNLWEKQGSIGTPNLGIPVCGCKGAQQQDPSWESTYRCCAQYPATSGQDPFIDSSSLQLAQLLIVTSFFFFLNPVFRQAHCFNFQCKVPCNMWNYPI